MMGSPTYAETDFNTVFEDMGEKAKKKKKKNIG